VYSTDGDSVAYERLDVTLPTQGVLADFVGRYRNDETESEIELRLIGPRLVAWRGVVLHDDLTAIFRDGFRAPSQSWIITMNRGPTNAIVGFDLGLPRI